MTEGAYSSWGRYPRVAQDGDACFWRSDLPAQLTQSASLHGDTLAYGLGRSYGDSCLAASKHVIDMSRLDKLISVDWSSGTVRAEAGVTLAQLLHLSIPHGWFLPVTPGTKFVTLGGAVANDVHGKNHHRRGSFGLHVRQIGLVRSDQGRLTCSRESHAALFAATIGGLGLTGVIDSVELQLMPVSSAQMACKVQRFDNLDEFFALSAELDDAHEYSVSWVDCLASGGALGRGIYTVADHAEDRDFRHPPTRRLAVPVTPPASLINRLSTKLFNEAYWRRQSPRRTAAAMSYDQFFYPLDGIRAWNRTYGPKGFQQYQCLLPENEAPLALRALLNEISSSGAASFLAVLKRFGALRSPGLLSFPRPGLTLAVDFPNQGAFTERLFERLDAIVREAQGRLYPAKDAHMSGADFRRAYPEWVEVERLRDPLLRSMFWKRVLE
jgi:FAD/FMN-containing dehydrogenase